MPEINMNRQELLLLVNELQLWEKTGILPDGSVREYAKKRAEELNLSEHVALRIAEMEIIQKVVSMFCSDHGSD